MNSTIIEILKEIGLPYACTCFAEGEAPDLPYIIYLTGGSDVLYADGTNFYTQVPVDFELYLERKTPRVEAAVEAVLNKHHIAFAKDETYISSESLYEVIYSFEMEDENHEEK